MRSKADHTPQNRYKAPAVHRAIHLLRAVAEAPHGMRLTELAARLGCSTSSAHGLVQALLRERALVRGDNSHKLHLGPLVTDLAFTDWNYLKINRLAQPVINDLRDLVRATVFLGVRVNTRVMITATADAVESFKITAPVGTTIPLFAGAVGKVLLCRESAERIGELAKPTGLPRYTPNSIVDMADYLAEMETARSRGYAIDDEEYISGIRAVAAALNNRRGPPMAVWVVGIASNMDLTRLESVAEMTTAAAKKLRSQLEEKEISG